MTCCPFHAGVRHFFAVQRENAPFFSRCRAFALSDTRTTSYAPAKACHLFAVQRENTPLLLSALLIAYSHYTLIRDDMGHFLAKPGAMSVFFNQVLHPVHFVL